MNRLSQGENATLNTCLRPMSELCRLTCRGLPVLTSPRGWRPAFVPGVGYVTSWVRLVIAVTLLTSQRGKYTAGDQSSN